MKPLVVVLQGELNGKPGTMLKGTPDAELTHLDALVEAVLYSSRIRRKKADDPAEKGAAAVKGEPSEEGAPADEDKTEDLVGMVTQTKEQRKEGVVTFTPRDGGDSQRMKLAEIERLDWFRNALFGMDYELRTRYLIDPKKVDENRNAGKDVPNQNYVLFTMAWVYDDGGTVLPVEALGME